LEMKILNMHNAGGGTGRGGSKYRIQRSLFDTNSSYNYMYAFYFVQG